MCLGPFHLTHRWIRSSTTSSSGWRAATVTPGRASAATRGGYNPLTPWTFVFVKRFLSPVSCSETSQAMREWALLGNSLRDCNVHLQISFLGSLTILTASFGWNPPPWQVRYFHVMLLIRETQLIVSFARYMTYCNRDITIIAICALSEWCVKLRAIPCSSFIEFDLFQVWHLGHEHTPTLKLMATRGYRTVGKDAQMFPTLSTANCNSG